jgi:glutathione S-transferase
VRLYYTPTSPFVRKVMLVAHEKGIAPGIETVLLRPTPTKADGTLSRDNPLSKIPALVLPDGTALYDSSVICEYLDSLADGAPRLIPERGDARWRVLRTQALADGILEAGIAVFYERTMRPKELVWEAWLAGQAEKALQGLDALEASLQAFSREVDLGQLSLGAAIGWLEFRGVLGDIRVGRRGLFAWYDTFRQRPSMQATEPRLA